MQVDACFKAFKPVPVKEGSKTYKQQVKLHFFDYHDADFEIVSNNPADFLRVSDKLLRTIFDVDSFDRKISFKPHSKAFDEISPVERAQMQGQDIRAILSVAPCESYEDPAKVKPTQYFHTCTVLDPTDLSDTGITVRFNLPSPVEAVDPGYYRGSIFFRTGHDKKYSNPIISAALAGNQLADFIPDLSAIAS